MATLKDSHIQFKIDSDSKEIFQEICKEMCINPSDWLRKQVQDFTASKMKKK